MVGESSTARVRYSPFRKPLAKLKARDLAALREVPEGWWIEYKRQPNGKLGIAKSISAFANSEGGWLFYGVNEVDVDGEKRAGTFDGVSVSSLASVRNDIRTAANHHVRPTPFYEVRALRGPCDEIGLPADRAVVVVLVPYGHDAPYIHSRGVVYRRKADEADPVRETDRNRLDMLWERGRRERLRLSQMLSEAPRLSDCESNQSYMQLFLLTDPFGERGIESRIGLEEFRRVMASSGSPDSLDVKLDNTYRVGDSFVARMTTGNTPYILLPSLAYRPDCSTVAIVPINGWPISEDQQEIRSGLSQYEQTGAFLSLLQPERVAVGAHVVDVNYLMLLLMAFMGKHRALLEREGHRPPVMVKMRFGNLWRRVPFLDTVDYIEGVRKFGVPLIEESTIMVPAGTEPETLVRTEPKDWRKPTESRPIVPSSIEVSMDALRALAVLDHLHFEESDGQAMALRLISAAYRAVGIPFEGGWDEEEE